LPLIEIIEKRMPDFWEDSEKTFERDLAATGYGGFCKGIPFFGPLVPDPESPDIDDQHLPNESHPQVAWTVKTIREQAKDRELRSLAYAGWLVTNPEFLEERDAIRRRWEAARPEHIGFPARRLVSNQPSPTTDPKRSGAKQPEIAEIMGFYDRWSLFTLHTWDFPQPMMSISGRSDADRSGTLSDAGLHVFLPWYLLRDEQTSLRQIATNMRKIANPDHLDDWFARSAGDQRKLGYKRLKNIFILHCFWKLALADRYGKRLAGRTERMDEAFAFFLSLSAASIKPLRHALGMMPTDSQ
jgi:hypothetical protein